MNAEKRFTTLKKATNEKGQTFALAVSPDKTYSVHVLKENYNGRVKGGLLKTWAYLKKGLNEVEALALFQKKVGV